MLNSLRADSMIISYWQVLLLTKIFSLGSLVNHWRDILDCNCKWVFIKSVFSTCNSV